MICMRCDSRAETRDCSSEELYYRLCDSCIKELKEKGELNLWDNKYKFAIKKTDNDYWELYEDRELLAKVHKDDIEKFTQRLNQLYDEKHDYYMKINNIEFQLKGLLRNINGE